jgi:SAM-dependent methyltransferase
VIDYDSRLVELYDADNPDGPDHDFYRALADDVGARSILDLGCGTGILTVTLAKPGRRVVGVDPSRNMLAYARARPRASAVHWVHGDSRDIPPERFDYAVMTGNVAQHIPEADWPRTLADVRRALTDGGLLAFESRNPARRAWLDWGSPERSTRMTPHGSLQEWMEVVELERGRIRLTAHNLFEDSGDHVVEQQELAFRDRETIEGQLTNAGFDVESVWGDWSRSPFRGHEPLMVFVARAV